VDHLVPPRDARQIDSDIARTKRGGSASSRSVESIAPSIGSVLPAWFPISSTAVRHLLDPVRLDPEVVSVQERRDRARPLRDWRTQRDGSKPYSFMCVGCAREPVLDLSAQRAQR